MKAFNSIRAQEYLKSIDITGTPRGITSMDASTDTGAVFDQARVQAQVVGSAVLSFSKGIPEKVRAAISDSALLAQLVANKEFSSFDLAPVEWFKKYSEVLENIGWVTQEQGWAEYEAKGNAAEVHEKFLEVLLAALAPSVAAAAVLTATINALRAMSPESKWFTIFSRETQRSTMARFQIGLVEAGTDGLVVSLFVCMTQAENNLTQVLFFKYKDAFASFRANSIKASLNEMSLEDLAPLIRRKVVDYQKDYLGSIKDL